MNMKMINHMMPKKMHLALAMMQESGLKLQALYKPVALATFTWPTAISDPQNASKRLRITNCSIIMTYLQIIYRRKFTFQRLEAF